MRKLIFGTLASFMFIAFFGALPSMSFAEEDTWTNKADMPTARDSFSTSVVNGKIYAIGGQGPGWVSLSTVEEYDPRADEWTKKADMPNARQFLSASAVKGKIYAIGGWNGVSLSTVEEYDTGFAGESIEAKGKFATLWGKLKAEK